MAATIRYQIKKVSMKRHLHPQQIKAILALSMASNMLASAPAPAANTGSTYPLSVIRKIADNSALEPELRAYFLLQMADQFLGAADPQITAAAFNSSTNEPAVRVFKSGGRALWTEMLNSAMVGYCSREYRDPSFRVKNVSAENASLTKSAMNAALSEIDKSRDQTSKLGLLLISSKIALRVGDKAAAERYQSIVNKRISSVEALSNSDTADVIGACRPFNPMSNSFVDVNISETDFEARGTNLHNAMFSVDDFQASEKLRLRALALLDKLPSTNHDRRKGHRDMVIWYQELGRNDLAEAQKETLFGLVGIHDDSVLYPQHKTCSLEPVWWQLPPTEKVARFCGMG